GLFCQILLENSESYAPGRASDDDGVQRLVAEFNVLARVPGQPEGAGVEVGGVRQRSALDADRDMVEQLDVSRRPPWRARHRCPRTSGGKFASSRRGEERMPSPEETRYHLRSRLGRDRSGTRRHGAVPGQDSIVTGKGDVGDAVAMGFEELFCTAARGNDQLGRPLAQQR